MTDFRVSGFSAQEAYRLQWRSFSGLVYERRHLPGLKALLKLYTSISLSKLASLLDGLDESNVRAQLILLKVRQESESGTRSINPVDSHLSVTGLHPVSQSLGVERF